ncbi:acyltransferase family protein [Pseudoduganella sp. UC29_106]|uniref:acyltransferase family protein n=1 Tax=Pseudoduganella sp. UC29_106 TaxID=3374553 RepID=UPI0037570B03
MPDAAQGMSRQLSLYLDLLRFLAALTVLVSHASGHTLGGRVLPVSLGHNAVIVFFLLSGYVIAHVADHKERSPRAFWISRFARVYSVALPAILLTPLVDQIGLHIDPGFYAGGMTTHDYSLVRIVASLGFVNELWFVSIMPFSNSPYWSLCYEMSYYLLFAIYTFAGQRRWFWLALAALVIGPKILLLAPIWLVGVVLYRQRSWYHISEAAGWLLWSTSLLAAAAFQYWDLTDRIAGWLAGQVGPELFYAAAFLEALLGRLHPYRHHRRPFCRLPPHRATLCRPAGTGRAPDPQRLQPHVLALPVPCAGAAAGTPAAARHAARPGLLPRHPGNHSCAGSATGRHHGAPEGRAQALAGAPCASLGANAAGRSGQYLIQLL